MQGSKCVTSLLGPVDLLVSEWLGSCGVAARVAWWRCPDLLLAVCLGQVVYSSDDRMLYSCHLWPGVYFRGGRCGGAVAGRRGGAVRVGVAGARAHLCRWARPARAAQSAWSARPVRAARSAWRRGWRGGATGSGIRSRTSPQDVVWPLHHGAGYTTPASMPAEIRL